MRSIVVSVLALVVLAAGCATYRDDLNRAERHYQSNEHEQALALFRVLEQDWDSLSPVDRTRYAYLRGMTDYRLSGNREPAERTKMDNTYRTHARYWLGLANSMETREAGALSTEWKETLGKALTDLNEDVYGESVAAETEAAKGDTSKTTEQPTPSDETMPAGSTEEAAPRAAE